MCLHNSVGSTWQTTRFLFLWADKLQSEPIGLHEIILNVLITSTTRNVLHIRHWHLSRCFDSARVSACLIRSVPSLNHSIKRCWIICRNFVLKSSTMLSAILHDSRTTAAITGNHDIQSHSAWRPDRVNHRENYTSAAADKRYNTESHQDRQYPDNNSFLFPPEGLFERRYANIQDNLFF